MVGAFIAAAISTGIKYATSEIAASAILATFAKSFAINAAISVVSKQLMDQPSFDSLQSGLTVNERRPTSTRKVVYGTRRVGGTVVFLDTVDADGKENRDLEMAIVLAAHECESVDKIYFNDELAFTVNASDPQTFDYVADSPYTSDFASIEARLGAAGQSPFSAPLVTSSKWTSDHRLDGVCSLYVRLKFDPQVFSNGLPNVSAEIRGKKVEDPRDSSVAFSDNAALCIRDYLINDDYGMGVAATEIDDSAFGSAADVCDEQVPLSGGGTESRYAVNGVVDTKVTPRENIAQMLTAMSGKLVYSGGLFKLFPGEYRTPSITLDEDDLIAPITITTKNSQRENFNRIKGTFSSPADLFQPVEYPAVESTTYQAIDGFTSTFVHDLPFTTSSATAQRLAKLQLNKTRQELTITMPCKLTALNVAPGDFIQVNNSRLNFTNKVFEVVSTDISTKDPLSINVVAQEVSQATYDWTATDEQAIINNNAPVTRQYQVNPISNLTTSSAASVAPDGTAISTISVSWDESPHRAVFEYEVTYRFDSNEPYQSVITSGTSVDLNGLVAGQPYTIRVRGITSTGAFSAYVTDSIVAAGDTTAPSIPTGVSAVGRQGAVLLDWTGNTEDDLKGYYIYQHTANQFSNSTQIAFVNADQFFRANLDDNDTFYFWITAIDFSGNESSPSSVASATTLPEPTDGTSVLVVYAEDASGSNQSLTAGSRQFVQYVEYVGTAPSLPVSGTFVQFAGTAGDPGQSIFPIYATSAAGANQSFDSTGREYVTFYESTSQPSLPVSGQTFVKFVGEDGDDGVSGDTGPRNATGYVFYQIQQDTGPGTPSASSYNFNDGTFSGLTLNWDDRVSTQTPEEGKNYWASRYSVSETTFGGAQSISFTPSFVWQNFDGLVTFTNIQDGIDDNVTTIDGGNVDLVNLDADNISTGSLSANRIQVDDQTITASGGNLIIKNLGVDTLQIAGNAVTIPVSQTVSAQESGTGSAKEIQWLNVTLDAAAKLVVLWSGSQFFTDGLRNNVFELRIDGVSVQSRGGLAITVAPTLLWSADRSAGTYRVAVWWNGADSTVAITERTLTALGAKR